MEAIKTEEKREGNLNNFWSSPSVKQIAPAFIAAQAKFNAAIKDSDNPYFHSKYASLASTIKSCKEALSEQGIAILQPTTNFYGAFGVMTILLHKSGEYLSGFYEAVSIDKKPQSVGSAVTYARRYGLAALAGIIVEDDDGEGAMQRGPGRPPIAQPHTHKPKEPSFAGMDMDMWEQVDPQEEFEKMTGQSAGSVICECGNSMMRSMYPEHVPPNMRDWYCSKCKKKKSAKG